VVGVALTLLLGLGFPVMTSEVSIATTIPASGNPIPGAERRDKQSAAFEPTHSLGLQQLKVAEHALATDDGPELKKLRSMILDEPDEIRATESLATHL
jgi:hypothetical protein